jgi:FdhE protein
MLRHAISIPDLAAAGAMTIALLARLGEDASTDPARVVPWLLGEDDLIPPSPALLRYLGWTATARWLAPVVRSFDAWRDEERWQRPYCPFCASLPAMAQLAGVDPGKRRLLACGCCGSRWQFRRTMCPFFETDPHRLPSLTIEMEPELRIDHCTSCRGYLKTYVGEGNEGLMLSDWSSLHLDIIARDRGLVRATVSLYELTDVA